MSKYPEMETGVEIAKKLKVFHYGDRPWDGKIAWDVGVKLAEFKKVVRKFYPEMDEPGMLRVVGGYTQQEIADVYAMDAHLSVRKADMAAVTDNKLTTFLKSAIGAEV